MYYFIFAMENMYQGLHGIYDYNMIECHDYNEACEIGQEMSHYVIDSFINPEEIYYTKEDFLNDNEYDTWHENYCNEYYDALDEAIENNIYYEIYPVKSNITLQDYQKWQYENMPPRDFIDRFCRELTGKDCI